MKTDKNVRPVTRRRKFLFCVIIFLLFIALAGIVETTVRLTTSYIPAIKFYISGDTHADTEGGKEVFEGDALLGWKLKTRLDKVWWDFTTFSTNGQHVRYDREIKRKRADTFRIVCFGDSVTFGYRIPLTRRNNKKKYDKSAFPFPKIMENSLLSLYKERDVEVIPFAVPGYTSYQGLAWFKDTIGWLKPDVVIVNYGYNDTNYIAQEYKTSFPVNWYNVFARWLVARSQTAIHLSSWYSSLFSSTKQEKKPTLKPAVSSGDYVNNILDIAKLAIENRAKVVVLGQVYRKPFPNSKRVVLMGENRKLLAKACFGNSVPYLEIEELTEKSYPNNKHFFSENIHPSKTGHKLMADRLLTFLTKTGMLSELKSDDSNIQQNSDSLVEYAKQPNDNIKAVQGAKDKIELSPILSVRDTVAELFYAAESGDITIIKDLVSLGTDVNSQDKAGWSPLHFAAEKNYIDIVRFLLKNRAETSIKDNVGITPLHIASWEGNENVVKILISNNANINAKTSDGWIPLHFASESGQSEIVRLLIVNGANINAKGEEGLTPLDLARESGNNEIAEIMVKHLK